MKPLDSFSNHLYLNLETQRKNGDVIATPLWFVSNEGFLYVRTIETSGKVKRVRGHPEVRVMPCGPKGEPLGTWHPARVTENNDPQLYQQITRLLVQKYGEIVNTYETQAISRGESYIVLCIDLLD